MPPARCHALTWLASALGAWHALAGVKFQPNPAPVCPTIACPDGQRLAPALENQIWTYGCKESAISLFSPEKGEMSPKNFHNCCVRRDACLQTCGMPSQDCHLRFEKCTHSVCKGDHNCELSAALADMTGINPSPEEDADDDGEETETFDLSQHKCKKYRRFQRRACRCVEDAEYDSAVRAKVNDFYAKFNPEKLNAEGLAKDLEAVLEKWEGKEPELLLTLAMKYRKQVVELREMPKNADPSHLARAKRVEPMHDKKEAGAKTAGTSESDEVEKPSESGASQGVKTGGSEEAPKVKHSEESGATTSETSDLDEAEKPSESRGKVKMDGSKDSAKTKDSEEL